jgi:hypothetical protein
MSSILLALSHTGCFLITTLYPQEPLANSFQGIYTRCQRTKVGGPMQSWLKPTVISIKNQACVFNADSAVMG